MGKTFRCIDFGVTGCDFEAKADTEEEVMEMVKAHAPVHDIQEITPAMEAQIKAIIKEE